MAGALLHDIGRNRSQTVHQGYVRAEILEKEGIDPVVVEIVRDTLARASRLKRPRH